MSDTQDLKHDRLRYRSAGLISNFRTRSERSRLANVMRSYSVYRPPHPAAPSQLTLEQANENHTALMDEAVSRIKVIQQLLVESGITLTPENPTADSIRALDAWAYQQWPGIFDKDLWLLISRSFTFELSGQNLAIRSMLMDLSLLLSRCYLAVSQQAQWMLDARQDSLQMQAITCHRTVIKTMLQTDGAIRGADVIDLEVNVLRHYGSQKKDNSILIMDQRIGQIVGEPVVRLIEEKCSSS